MANKAFGSNALRPPLSERDRLLDDASNVSCASHLIDDLFRNINEFRHIGTRPDKPQYCPSMVATCKAGPDRYPKVLTALRILETMLRATTELLLALDVDVSSAISAVTRTMAILEAMSGQERGMTVTELVMQLDIEKSVVSRVLHTLEQDGYIIRDERAETFHIGLRFAAIALRHIDELGLADLCAPLLKEIADSTGELVQLAVLQGDQMIYVAKAEGQHRVRVLSLVGRSAVLHASTAGKVWLASLPEEQALSIALQRGLNPLTPKTINSIDGLRSELAQVRKDGFALVEEELVEGGNAVGVPVCSREHVIGAVVLSGPAYRLPRKRMVSLVPTLAELGSKLAELGSLDVRWGGSQVDEHSLANAKKDIA